MKFSLTLHEMNDVELDFVLKSLGLNGKLAEQAVEAPAPEMKVEAPAEVEKPKRAKKAKKEEAEAFDFGAEETPAPEEKTYTYDEVMKALNEYSKKKTVQAAINILKKFKVKSVKLIPQDKYPEVMKLIGA